MIQWLIIWDHVTLQEYEDNDVAEEEDIVANEVVSIATNDHVIQIMWSITML